MNDKISKSVVGVHGRGCIPAKPSIIVPAPATKSVTSRTSLTPDSSPPSDPSKPMLMEVSGLGRKDSKSLANLPGLSSCSVR